MTEPGEARINRRRNDMTTAARVEMLTSGILRHLAIVPAGTGT